MNINGEFIGINVAVRQGASGIGFANYINKAINVATGTDEASNSWTIVGTES